MDEVVLDLRIADPRWRAIGDLETACRCALSAGQAVARGPGGEVAVLLTDDDDMQALNRDWRGKDRPTDVLSFPAGPAPAGFLGDIALGYGVCSCDAAQLDRALRSHLLHLLIHGLLHIYGYDHIEDTQAAKMHEVEREALASLGLPDPYSGID